MLQWDLIDRLVKAERLVGSTRDANALRRSLEVWWSIKFSRPLKDPLLKEYTLEELAYEFLLHHYLNPENDPERKRAEESAAQDDHDWIAKQLKKETSSSPPVEPEIKPEDLPPEISARFDG